MRRELRFSLACSASPSAGMTFGFVVVLEFGLTMVVGERDSVRYDGIELILMIMRLGDNNNNINNNGENNCQQVAANAGLLALVVSLVN